MRFKTTAITAAILFAVPAVAQTATDTPAPKPEKKICRRDVVTGSIMGSKPVCHTREEWAKIDDVNGRDGDETLRRGRDLQNSGVGNTRTN